MKINVKKIVTEGKKLWKEHGDTVISVVKKIQSSKSKESLEDKDNTTTVLKKGIQSLLTVSDNNSPTPNQIPEQDGIPGQDVAIGTSELPQPIDSEETVLEKTNKAEEAEILEDDDFFHSSMDKLSSALEKAAEGGFTDPKAVAGALSALVEVATDTVKYVADQETKQEEIRAKRDVAIAQINATSACIKEYLDKTFDERSAIFAKQFECVDAALRTGNNEILAMSLNSINSLAASSPFKNLADINQVQQALGDSDTEWDI